MNSLNNERGVGGLIVAALMVLVSLTIIGIASTNVSNTEVKISTAHSIHTMEFYGADSAFAYGSVWAEENISPGDLGTGFGPEPYTLENGVKFTTEIECLAETEPITNMPNIMITGTGTHPRGGKEVLAQLWRFVPAYPIPPAPIWIDDYLNVNGSVLVNVEDPSTPEVIYDVPMPDIDMDDKHCSSPPCDADFSGDYGVTFFPAIVRENISSIANYSGSTFPTDLVANSSQGSPVVVLITGFDGTYQVNNSDLPSEGWGVLYVDGDFKINGSITWNGLIISAGKTLAGSGTVEINGAVITGRPKDGSEESIQVDMIGNLTINHRPDILQEGYDKLTGYKPTPSWHYVN